MAPKRNTRSKVLNNANYSNITLSNALCPICRCILIHPVTLPCRHDFCTPCFEGTLANANLTCPLCRVRFGSWHRIAKKDNKIINEKLWDALQLLFPKHVQNRLKGIDENLEEDSIIKLTTPGEIKKEYELQKRKQELEEQKKKDKEEKASSEFISKLKEQEEYEELIREEKLRLDEKVAQQIAKEMGFMPSVAASKVSTLPKKKRPLEKPHTKSQTVDIPHYFSNIINKEIIVKQKNLNFTIEKADSNDSIENECKYFRPIDHRHIPSSKSVTILKVPALIKKSPDFVTRSPSGNINFTHSQTISAFARFELVSPILGKSALDVEKSVQNIRKKRNSENKPINNSQLSFVKKQVDLIELENVYDNLFKLSKTPSVTPQKRMSLRNNYQPENPKVNGMKEIIKPQPRKRKISSPFIGFDKNETEGGLLNGHKRKSKGGDKELKGREMQEKEDLEFARKLQEEFNKERYTTRSSINCRSNIKKSRQVTIPEMVASSKCK